MRSESPITVARTLKGKRSTGKMACVRSIASQSIPSGRDEITGLELVAARARTGSVHRGHVRRPDGSGCGTICIDVARDDANGKLPGDISSRRRLHRQATADLLDYSALIQTLRRIQFYLQTSFRPLHSARALLRIPVHQDVLWKTSCLPGYPHARKLSCMVPDQPGCENR